MPSITEIVSRLLWAAVVGLATVVAPAQAPPAPQPPSTRPAASQPVGDAGGDGMADVDDVWRDPQAPDVLTTVADLRALTPEQAAEGWPVRIRGTVTYLASVPPMMFVQDATGGVCVSGPRERELRTQIRYGTKVQVEGVTGRSGDIAYVTSPDADPVRLQVLGPGRLPAPRLATVPQLATHALHGDLVEVEGVVRSVRRERPGATGPGATVLRLSQGGSRIEAVIFGRAAEEIAPEQLVGAVVRARGVLNAAAPLRREIVAGRLLLRSVRDLRVRAAATPAQALPVVAISTLKSLIPGQPVAATRVRVQGVVTLALAGRGMFIEDTSGGVWVNAPDGQDRRGDEGEDKSPPDVKAGDGVDVVAFPGRRGWSTVLADAAWRVTGKAPMPPAPRVTAEQALAPEMDARLVRIDALVLSVSRISQHATLVLQTDGRVFLAGLADPAAEPPPAVSEGSWIRATGVCVQTFVEDGWSTGGGAATSSDTPETEPFNRPPSFHLLLASNNAVDVISAPGWWTLRRVLVVCGVLAAVALASIGWVVALRRRVARQTGTIREHLARRTLYEERVRIARDLHDSLEQDLLGITLQLNATEKLLAQPDRARQSLQLAAAMVRRSQAETHRAVWDLREQRPGQHGIVSAVREAVVGLTAPRTTAGADGEPSGGDAPEGPRIEVRAIGEPRQLPPQVENHLLRVALEAVTNAVKHAGATRIDVEIVFGSDRVEARVSDDGRGFDADRLPPPSSGHFGLFGMRERAEKLGGELIIRSRQGGGGTEIRLVAPWGEHTAGHTAHIAARAHAVTP